MLMASLDGSTVNKHQGLQNIWATTDQTVIGRMIKKTSQPPLTHVKNHPTDENSDSESLDSSCGSFVAVPKEFRPSLPASVKIGHSEICKIENTKGTSKLSPTSSSKNTFQKTLPKVPLLPSPKPALTECKTFLNQNEVPDSKKTVNSSKHPMNLQKIHQIPNDTTTAQNKASVKYNSGADRKTQLQPPKKMTNNTFQKQGSILCIEEPNKGNDRNISRCKFVDKQNQRTVKFNFEMSAIPNPFCSDAHTVSYQESIIKWDSSLNLREQNCKIDKLNQDSGKNAHILPYQKNIVKWDSSLNLDTQNSEIEGKTEQNFGEDTHTVSSRKHIVKWHSSLNPEELCSDTEGEIEWTIIQKKITVSAKKVQGKNYIHKQSNDECPVTKPYKQKKFTKWHHKKNFNNMKYNINHQKNTPDCKVAEKVHSENSFQLHNDLKCDNMEVRNCKMQKECSLDAETYAQQCKIIEKNLDNQINPSSSNEMSEFIINNNTRKNINSRESNFYPEKIDNATLKHVEEQKKSVLYYGREMADLIIGSHTALSVFISMFSEWKRSRLELIRHFDKLETNLKESAKEVTQYKEILSFIKTGATFVAAVPVPHVSIAAKVLNVLTGLFSAFLTKTETEKADKDSYNITLAASKDTDAANEMYEYGLLCSGQFEETAKLIEKFHSNAGDPVIFESDSPEIATFIRGILEYRPNHRIFYKKLHACFQELLHSSTSEFSKRFCEPFRLYSSEAVDIIGLLDWRFRHEDFNSESVRFELREIELLLERNANIKELKARVQNCVRFLEDELKFLERCVKDITLFDNSIGHGIKAF